MAGRTDDEACALLNEYSDERTFNAEVARRMLKRNWPKAASVFGRVGGACAEHILRQLHVAGQDKAHVLTYWIDIAYDCGQGTFAYYIADACVDGMWRFVRSGMIESGDTVTSDGITDDDVLNAIVGVKFRRCDSDKKAHNKALAIAYCAALGASAWRVENFARFALGKRYSEARDALGLREPEGWLWQTRV